MSIKPSKKNLYFSSNSSLVLDKNFKLLNFPQSNTSKSSIANINNFKDAIKNSKNNNQIKTKNSKYKSIKNSRK